MDVLHAIESRRSIRRFKPDPLSKEIIEQILDAARLSPSGKNKQPWRFVVVQGEEREAMSARLQAGLKKTQQRGMQTGSAENTFRIMRQAPVTIFVLNPGAAAPWQEHSIPQQISQIVDIQSIGGAIQSMLLRAQELGIGSLWICDTFSAYEELCTWLETDGLLVAAVSLGYADEEPAARPRLSLDAMVEWRG